MGLLIMFALLGLAVAALAVLIEARGGRTVADWPGPSVLTGATIADRRDLPGGTS